MNSSRIIPGEHLPDSSDFYDLAPLEPTTLYQGEILVDIPFLNMPKDARWLILRTRSGKMVDEALKQGGVGGLVNVLDSNQSAVQWHGATDGDFVMARLSKRPVIVLSQTCDVQTKQFIQVAPIYPAEGSSEHVERLRSGKLLSAFFLKEHQPDFPDSYADLELIQAVHKTYIKKLRPEHHFRLTPARIRELQRYVTRYFGRPNSFDAKSDLAPTDGTYLCASCFYLDGRVTSRVLSVGQQFERCNVCGVASWILQGR